MDRVGSYGIYQNNYYDKARSAKETGASKTSESSAAKKTEKNSQVTLSDNAKKLLKQLQKDYRNMDFIVADYETDEEAASYLSRGKNQYSVLLTPEELEKMAADENVKNQNLKVLDEAVVKLDEMKKQLGDKGQDISRLGIAIDNNGEISYFAELEKVSERQRERIEEQRENKREEKRTTVQASSVEELAEKIGQVDWSAIAEEVISSGHRFNFTV